MTTPAADGSTSLAARFSRRGLYSGLIALACWAAHAFMLIRTGDPHDLLWTCNVGALAVAVGTLLNHRAINAIGTLFLTVGFPIWIIGLFTTSGFLPTSALNHIVVLTIGWLSCRRLGMPRHEWFAGTFLYAALLLISYFATPIDANVNTVHELWQGDPFGARSGPVRLVTRFAVGAALFWAAETLIRGRLGMEQETMAG